MTPTKFFKRYRMERALEPNWPAAELPAGYRFLPWSDRLLSAHAETMYQCFRNELDVHVFPAFATPAGCSELMQAIWYQAEFCPQATWLIVGPDGVVGSVQGLCDGVQLGAVQNLGVLPSARGCGLGRALLAKALHGFRAAGVGRAYLEVTALNVAAVRLYRGFGFRNTRTIFRPAPAPSPVGVGL